MEKTDFYRTDLLVESEEMVRHQTEQEQQKLEQSKGIHFEEERVGRVLVTKVEINAEGEKKIGKKQGRYVTLTMPTLHADDEAGMQEMTNVLLQQMDWMIPTISSMTTAKVLFIGLGNREVTPDAIGPLTMDHLQDIVPLYFSETGGEVAVYAPGVTIQTGLETADFIRAVTTQYRPDLLVVVDALAARDSARLCKTIQLTNTGIHPGSGVGNNRKEVSEETLGIPVLAVGIPTVVDGPVMIADAVDTLFNYIASQIEEQQRPSAALSVTPWLRENTKDVDRSTLLPIFGDWAAWPHEERRQLFEEVLTTHQRKTFISPKEIDAWVAQYADALATSFIHWLDTIKKTD